MAGSVQFKSRDQAIEAFENRDAKAAWSIWHHKQFMFRGVGVEELETTLDLLAQSTNVTYTIKIYEEITDPKMIKENTASDGSFNFKLNEPGQEQAVNGIVQYNAARKGYLDEKLKEQDDKINLILEKLEGDPPEEKGIMGFVSSMIKGPEDIVTLVNLAKSMLGFTVPPVQQITPAPGRMGNTAPVDEEEKVRRMQEAINILEQNDPKLEEHLVKLADLSQRDPKQFLFLTAMLEKL